LLPSSSCAAPEEEAAGTRVTVPASGEVVYGLNNVSFQAPEDTFSRDITFDMSVVDEHVSADGVRIVSDVYEFGPAAKFLDAPITVSLPFDGSLLEGPRGNILGATAVSLSGNWETFECEISQNGDFVSCPVDTLRYLAVIELVEEEE